MTDKMHPTIRSLYRFGKLVSEPCPDYRFDAAGAFCLFCSMRSFSLRRPSTWSRTILRFLRLVLDDLDRETVDDREAGIDANEYSNSSADIKPSLLISAFASMGRLITEFSP